MLARLSNHHALPLLVAVAAVAAGSVPGAEPDSLASALRPFCERGALAGAVALVATGHQTLHITAIGSADRGRSKPMRTDALFWIASETKPITAAAVMMLVEDGRVNLDDPVAKYLPEFDEQMVVLEKTAERITLERPRRGFTLRESLSHMTGLPFKSPVETPTLDALPLATAVRSYAALPLQWQPGTRYQYSNAGINTAARVLEVVSGMPYETFLDERIFKPLGMQDTTFWPSAEQLQRLATSYKPDETKTRLVETTVGQLTYPLDDRVRRHPMPAGGLFSTAGDMARFGQMLLRGGELDGHRVLSEASVAEMCRRQTPESVKERYGLGLAVGDDVYGHGGAYATQLEILPSRNLVLVWMVQHAGFPLDGKDAQAVFKQWARAMPAPADQAAKR
jgi:CubicO group peptidase (beta-lactamase class C family)